MLRVCCFYRIFFLHCCSYVWVVFFFILLSPYSVFICLFRVSLLLTLIICFIFMFVSRVPPSYSNHKLYLYFVSCVSPFFSNHMPCLCACVLFSSCYSNIQTSFRDHVFKSYIPSSNSIFILRTGVCLPSSYFLLLFKYFQSYVFMPRHDL